MAYICTQFHENILDGVKVMDWTRFSKEKNQKGHNSVTNVGRVLVFVLCTSSDDFYICTKFHENIWNGRVMRGHKKLTNEQTDRWTDGGMT